MADVNPSAVHDSAPFEDVPPPLLERAQTANLLKCSACGEILRAASNDGQPRDAAAQARDRAASRRDSRAEDRDEAAELRDRGAEERDELLLHDLQPVDDRHLSPSARAASQLDQQAGRGERQSADGRQQAAADELAITGAVAGNVSRGGRSDHERDIVSALREAARRHDDAEAARREDIILLARDDRLKAADDREDAADDRREGARERASARENRDESALAERRAVETLESISEAFFTVDADWRFIYLNPQSEAILDRRPEDLIGKNMWEEFPEGIGSRFDDEYRRVLRDQTPTRFEARYEPLDRILEVRIFPLADGLAVYFRDVTAERGKEERLRQAQRLEAIGQTTAGVVHDFGNILAAVRGFAHLGQAATSSERAAHYFAEIDRAGVKAAELTRQLLAFARQQELAPTVIDLNDVVEHLSSILAQLVSPGIELRFDLSPQPVAVFVDRSQLEQVLVNLVMNSSDAIDTSGTITVVTSSSDPRSIAHERASPSGWLQVTDDGSGIPSEVMPRIFDPFFSTKPPETGTGLGLATIYGIVSQSGGAISVDSTPGSGTTMTVALPRSAPPQRSGDTQTAPGSRAPEGRGDSARSEQPADSAPNLAAPPMVRR